MMKTKRTVKPRPAFGTLFTVPVIIATGVLAVILVAVVLAPLLAPYNPDKLNLGESLQSPSALHWFGTDKSGRDIFSRILYGGRTTMLSALGVVAISLSIGIPLGLISGYFGGKIDSFIMRLWDIVLAFPSLLLAFIFVAAFGKGLSNAILAIGIVYIPMISRLARSLTLTEKHKMYVASARSLGYSNRRILFRHILPNCVSTLIAEITLDLGYAILDLAALNFIGLGIQPPTADWGAMMQEGLIYISTYPVIALAPGIAIIVTVVSINVLSDGIQAYLDPNQRKLPSIRKIKKLQAGGFHE
jgi:peptide/nickel transport system permease protein